ncbi:MAG: ABC transporter ATP-binding protein [Acidisphaera sp.]|nr:ABC transporter ATP-binding protein [Acidisphaera sp.]
MGEVLAAPRAAEAPTAPAAVRLESVTHRFGDFTALAEVSLAVARGSFCTLLGPSGSGKSTLLRIIAGLTRPSTGRVHIAGRDVSRLPPQKRGVGFVFQNYALFPHLTVFENIAYPLRIRRMPTSEITPLVERVLARVNLVGLGQRRPAQLSGGQQQRVAVARALIYEPAVLLMDEPLGALDRKLRRHMQIELRQLQQSLGITCIYVTHDQEEALTMSDRIAVMRDGRILQVGDPVTVYRHPGDAFVADFVGVTNLLRCTRDAGSGAWITAGGALLPIQADRAACLVSLRPETIRIDEPGCDIVLPARIDTVTFVGNLLDVSCRLDSGESLRAELPAHRADGLHPGQAVRIGWRRDDATIFPDTDFRQSEEPTC